MSEELHFFFFPRTICHMSNYVAKQRSDSACPLLRPQQPCHCYIIPPPSPGREIMSKLVEEYFVSFSHSIHLGKYRPLIAKCILPTPGSQKVRATPSSTQFIRTSPQPFITTPTTTFAHLMTPPHYVMPLNWNTEKRKPHHSIFRNGNSK